MSRSAPLAVLLFRLAWCLPLGLGGDLIPTTVHASATSSVGGSTASPPPVTYLASGSIDSVGVDGVPVVQILPTEGTLTPGSPFDLGRFVVTLVGTGTTTYHLTPFQIDFTVNAGNGGSPSGGGGSATDPLVIRGWLSGTVGGSATDPGTLRVLLDQGVQPNDPTFAQLRPLPMWPSGSALGGTVAASLQLNGGQDLLSLDLAKGDVLAVPAAVTITANVPEPVSALIWGGLAVGLGVGRWVRLR